MPDDLFPNRNGREKALETLLLPFPSEEREAVTRAFHNVASGDPSSPLIQWATLITGLIYALQKKAELQPTTNGSEPGKMTPPQFFALKTLLEALPGKQDLQS